MLTEENVDNVNHAGMSGLLRSNWLAVGVLSLLTCVVLFYGLGSYSTLGSHEVFTTVPAREMIQADDWVVPRYGGLPRLKKPPFAYWCNAVMGSLVGEVNAWAVRLPSAISALLLVVLMGVWATRWYGPRAGFVAVIVQATSLSTISFGRMATVDMVMCLLATLAMFLVIQSRRNESGRTLFLRVATIHGLLAILWLSKFHFGPVMVLGPCVVFLLIQRQFRNCWHLVHPLGIVLQLAPLVAWAYLLLQEVPNAWDVWQYETVGRAVGKVDARPLWYYLPVLVKLTLPWGLLALFSVRDNWRRAWVEGDERERFLSVWFFTQLAILTISVSKHPNYILLALPVVTLLITQTAVRWLDILRNRRPVLRMTEGAAIIGVCLLGIAVVWTMFPGESRLYLQSPIRYVAMITGLGISGVTCLLMLDRARIAGGLSLIIFLISYISVNDAILPKCDHRLAKAHFARKVRTHLNDEPVYVYRIVKAHSGLDPVIFYLNEPVVRVESIETLTAQLASLKTIHVIAYEQTKVELAQLGSIQQVMTIEPLPEAATSKGPTISLFVLTASSANRIESDPVDERRNRNSEERPKDRIANETRIDHEIR